MEARRGVARRLFIVFGMVVILGMFASSLLATILMRPIRELSAGEAELKNGSSQHPLKICSNNELGRLTAAAVDARDAYTHGHSARVAQLSALIGGRIGLSQEDLGDLEIACLFHDVGKIKTPDAILLKQGRLSPAEYKEMMQHVVYGSSILSWAPSLVKYIPSTRHHHEWHNGKGYPDGLSLERKRWRRST
jgi:HD-GYP domain-containing protein (c-di-GMP phosphodiesterase class II)